MATRKREMLQGVFWSAVEKYSGLIVSIIVSMILARLLSPKEYGVIAVATVFIQFLQMFCTMGIGPAVIQRDDLRQKDLDSIFTFAVCIGLVLGGLFFCFSWSIADFYKNSQLVPVCQILSVQLFFAAANMVPNALMAKNKRFKQIAKRTLYLQLISGVISIVAAYHGAGVYSLLISPIFTAIGIFIFNRLYYPVNLTINFKFEPIKRIFSFSLYQFLFDFVNYFSRNLDKLIIGKCMGISELGIYEKSYRLMQLPMNNLTSVVNPVLQPTLRDLQDDKERIAAIYKKIISYLSSVSFPLGLICSMCSSEIIYVFYGRTWNAAIPVFTILALSLPLQIILSTSGAIFMAINNTKAQFWVGIRNTITTVLGFIIAAYFWRTVEAIAWAWVITLLVNFLFTYFILYHHILENSFRKMMICLFNPFINSLLIIILLLIENKILQSYGIILSLVIKASSATILSVLFVQYTNRFNVFSMIRSLISINRK